MSGELRPAFLFHEGDEFDAIWSADLKYRPDNPKHRTVRVAKIARKYVYFEVGGWGADLHKQKIDSPSRNISGWQIVLPQLDAYEERVKAAWAVLKEHGLQTVEHGAPAIHDEKLFAVADALGRNN
jgi:hypothetical protein